MARTNPKIYNSVEYSFFKHFIMVYSVSLIIVALIYAALLMMSYSIILLLVAIINCLVFLCLDLYHISKFIILLTCYNDIICEEVISADMIVAHPYSNYTGVCVFVDGKSYRSDKAIKLEEFSSLVKNDKIKVGINLKNQRCIVFYD